MSSKICFLLLIFVSFYITTVVPQYRNRPAAVQRPQPNRNARAYTPRRTQRQAFLQYAQQSRRPAASNPRPVRAQAALPARHVQYVQQPQKQQRPRQTQRAPARKQFAQPSQQQRRAGGGTQPRTPTQQRQPQLIPQQRSQPVVAATATASATAGTQDFRNNFGNEGNFGYGGFGGYGGGYGFGGGYYQPHRPNPNLYRNFASLYRDLDSKAEGDYDNRAEMDEINDDFNGRSIVAAGQYPHIAALGFRSALNEIEFKCGGSLISEVFVLTAAHCCYLNGQTPEMVKIGDIRLNAFDYDNMPQRRHVAQIMIHPSYNSSMHYHDIALLLLDRPVIYTHFVRPIRLWVADDIPYDKVYTMGYGSTSFAQAPTNVLTELDLSVVPLQQCNATLPADDNAPYGIVDSQICAKDYERNRDTCQGDSGGPLQLNLLRRRRRHRFRYYLVGITSYGTFCRSPYPGVYTRVSSYIEWISSVVWPDYFNTNFRYHNNFGFNNFNGFG